MNDFTFTSAELTFPERRDAIVARIKASRWYEDRDRTGVEELSALVEDLAIAGDFAEFNEVFDALYDRADYDRVWVKTR